MNASTNLCLRCKRESAKRICTKCVEEIQLSAYASGRLPIPRDDAPVDKNRYLWVVRFPGQA